MAQEMLRVVKRTGLIIWYDFHVDNPWNPNVRGVRKAEITRLFPSCSIALERVSLALPLAKMVAPRSWIVMLRPRSLAIPQHSLSRCDSEALRSMVFTNVLNPRSEIPRMEELNQQCEEGVMMGVSCTIVCGITIGRYVMHRGRCGRDEGGAGLCLVVGAKAQDHQLGL